MNIKKNLTLTNYKRATNKKNKYIVIHYTANNGDTAYNNTVYFKTAYRGASANYFVDEKNIYQCVEDDQIAWHCGTKGKYYHEACRNDNSIGIEMCSRKDENGKYYIKEEVINKTIELVNYLMKKYNIPKENVIRHYDVTHKACPEPFVRDVAQWNAFRAKLGVNVAGNTTTTPTTFKPYKVKITANALNVRKGAGTNYPVVVTVSKNEVYTIVGEKMNGSTKWLKLKSGAGYISSLYTKKV